MFGLIGAGITQIVVAWYKFFTDFEKSDGWYGMDVFFAIVFGVFVCSMSTWFYPAIVVDYPI